MERERIYIVELAELVNRRPATIRHWERQGILPKQCLPARNDRGWRYWTGEQAELIKAWLTKSDMRPSKGLPHYKPTAKQVEAHIAGQRLTRDPTAVALRRELITQEQADAIVAGELSLEDAKASFKSEQAAKRERAALAA